MRKRILCFIAFFGLTTGAFCATRDAQLTNTTPYNYNYMYPYLSNQMRTNLNPGTTTSQSLSPINTIVKTTPMAAQRRVVPRTGTGRSATTTAARRTIATTNARSATPSQTTYSAPATQRRVVARSGTSGTKIAATNRSSRTENSYNYKTSANAATNFVESDSARISSVRCMADYTKCMNSYCERDNTEYNRCYCSSKLAQIDSKYRPAIDSLLRQILTIKSTNQWSDNEMNEYWMNTVGKYYGENSFENIDNALNINWADTESRVRGQNAFNTGHEYCVQHLRGCYYMAANLHDAYRSEIARDCETYEKSLLKLQNAAESIVEAYK